MNTASLKSSALQYLLMLFSAAFFCRAVLKPLIFANFQNAKLWAVVCVLRLIGEART
jgi:hypothetical protein